jgi:hypothetical protein
MEALDEQRKQLLDEIDSFEEETEADMSLERAMRTQNQDTSFGGEDVISTEQSVTFAQGAINELGVILNKT